MSWIDNHKLAESECRTGWLFEDIVADRLRRASPKLHVETPPKDWRADVRDRKRYANEVDLWVNGGRLSVKSRRVKFTCPQDVPRNRNPLFVDTVRKWKLKDPEPVAVVCISQETQAIIWTPTSDQKLWGRRHAFDQVRSYADDFMTCDRELWYTFDRLVDQLTSLWDGDWETSKGIIRVVDCLVSLEGTADPLRWLVGQPFWRLAAGATTKPTRVLA